MARLKAKRANRMRMRTRVVTALWVEASEEEKAAVAAQVIAENKEMREQESRGEPEAAPEERNPAQLARVRRFICHGETLEGNDFEDSCVDFDKHIVEAFEGFLRQVFSVSECRTAALETTTPAGDDDKEQRPKKSKSKKKKDAVSNAVVVASPTTLAAARTSASPPSPSVELEAFDRVSPEPHDDSLFNNHPPWNLVIDPALDLDIPSTPAFAPTLSGPPPPLNLWPAGMGPPLSPTAAGVSAMQERGLNPCSFAPTPSPLFAVQERGASIDSELDLDVPFHPTKTLLFEEFRQPALPADPDADDCQWEKCPTSPLIHKPIANPAPVVTAPRTPVAPVVPAPHVPVDPQPTAAPRAPVAPVVVPAPQSQSILSRSANPEPVSPRLRGGEAVRPRPPLSRWQTPPAYRGESQRTRGSSSIATALGIIVKLREPPLRKRKRQSARQRRKHWQPSVRRGGSTAPDGSVVLLRTRKPARNPDGSVRDCKGMPHAPQLDETEKAMLERADVVRAENESLKKKGKRKAPASSAAPTVAKRRRTTA
ncbi:hypothetical protein B0H14DRAFT_3444537 [Mycena olivaceomarginata]|nr:hypothetical protein B0H14DRAFT_3444537 [Mycena olivaceomarginata]